MWLQVDPRLSTPIYLQIVEGVKEAVAKGILASGDRLPSVREFAASMTLNANTVAKAYQELERRRVIEVIRGRGTFVAEIGLPRDKERRVDEMERVMKQLWVEAQHLQISSQELLAMMASAVAKWDQERGRERA